MYYNIAPEIFRKRLIIEGKYNTQIPSIDFVYNFLMESTEQIHDADNILRGIRGPFVFDYAYDRKASETSSYDGFIIWNEHSLNTFIWNDPKFFTVDIYTCSDFDTDAWINFVTAKFECSEFTWHELPQPSPFQENSVIETRLLDDNLGYGVFAKVNISKDSYVTYIDGQILHWEHESQIQWDSVNHAVPFHRVFYRNAFSNIAVKINHSCDPNCYVKDLFCVHTMRDIEAWEELTMSYSLFCNSDWRVPGGKCLCGAKNCYGDIVPWRELTKEDKIKYLPYTSDWILFEEMKKYGFVEQLKDHIH